MLTQEKVIGILRREMPYLRDNFGVKKIALFGSFVKRTQRQNSDIDILVEFERPIGLKFIDLADYLEKVLGKKTDILTPEGIKGIRTREVAQNIARSLCYV
ncbi:MAG TPA: nucleotidyltransferase [Candidatus Omnitrophica bacterium]|nr:nucleotidyltransferase [Candidatus Omnitrophota bacterium]